MPIRLKLKTVSLSPLKTGSLSPTCHLHALEISPANITYMHSTCEKGWRKGSGCRHIHSQSVTIQSQCSPAYPILLKNKYILVSTKSTPLKNLKPIERCIQFTTSKPQPREYNTDNTYMTYISFTLIHPKYTLFLWPLPIPISTLINYSVEQPKTVFSLICSTVLKRCNVTGR